MKTRKLSESLPHKDWSKLNNQKTQHKRSDKANERDGQTPSGHTPTLNGLKLFIEGPYPNEKGPDYLPFVKITGNEGEMIKVFTNSLELSEKIAEFVVKAVNSYDSLVIALAHLKMLVSGLTYGIEIPKDGAAVIVAADIIRKCEQAIAKAEGVVNSEGKE